MAVANQQVLTPFKSGADLSAASNQYKIVKMSAGNAVNLSSTATDKHVGVLQNRPNTNEGAAVATSGRAKVLYGGTVAVGDRLTANASGAAIATTTAGNISIGVATAAGVSGDVGDVLLDISQV